MRRERRGQRESRGARSSAHSSSEEQHDGLEHAREKNHPKESSPRRSPVPIEPRNHHELIGENTGQHRQTEGEQGRAAGTQAAPASHAPYGVQNEPDCNRPQKADQSCAQGSAKSRSASVLHGTARVDPVPGSIKQFDASVSFVRACAWVSPHGQRANSVPSSPRDEILRLAEAESLHRRHARLRIRSQRIGA